MTSAMRCQYIRNIKEQFLTARLSNRALNHNGTWPDARRKKEEVQLHRSELHRKLHRIIHINSDEYILYYTKLAMHRASSKVRCRSKSTYAVRWVRAGEDTFRVK